MIPSSVIPRTFSHRKGYISTNRIFCAKMSRIKSIRLDLSPRERRDLQLIMREEGITTGAQVVRRLIKIYADEIRRKKREVS